MEISTMVMWLVAGVVLFLAEMGVPGIGLMFGGCGALTVGMLLNFSLIPAEHVLLQGVIFIVATALWAVVLWKPLQKLRLGKGKNSYSNIIGESATVGDKGISKTHGGEVLWSGAIMKARLPENSALEKIDAGTVVTIKEINGNILTVIPK